MNNKEHTTKKVSLHMKVEPSIANIVVEAYKKQMEVNDGIPYKGDYIGSVFSEALGKVTRNEKTEGVEKDFQREISSLEQKNGQKENKIRMLVAMVALLMLLIGIIFIMYRRSVRYV